ncbi:MAG: hypothetical protein FIA97_15420 [Methylococcaceae bacterium]|nr:hypothetical protein [Methylococcaceae bacterium]
MRSAVLAWLLTAPLAALAEGSAPCWYPAEVLSRHFGVPFGAGKPETDQVLGAGCKYSDDHDSISLFIGTIPPGQGMPTEMLRKFLIGPGNEAGPIPGDPDGAAVIRHGGDVSPFPGIIYERQGHTLLLHITGLWDRGHGGEAEALNAWNEKLAKLPRVPQ